jgi:hypothetical protein
LQGSTGVSRLAGVLTKEMVARGQKPDQVELGTVRADGNLLADRFAVPIPAGEWHMDAALDVAGQEPKPGDRVYIVWANDQTDPIVVGRFVTGRVVP